jgi:superfamily II DNA or RNA helicase
MPEIHIEYKNSAYIRVFGDGDSTEKNLSDYFTYEVPNAKFTPAYKKRIWDGKIRLYNIHTKCLYAGLYEYLLEYCDNRNISVVIDPKIPLNENKFSKEDIQRFFEKEVKAVSGGKKLIPHDHQIDAVMKALNLRRCLLLSPTASGKSLIIYSLVRYYQNIIQKNEKILIVVPTISLVYQMYKDFGDYSSADRSWNVDKNCHQIHGGQAKDTQKQVVISTWQSIYKEPEKYFKDFRVVLGDECHGFRSQSLTSIMTKLVNCPYRVGLTGTLDGTKTHRLMIEGLFGRTQKIVSTKELIDRKLLSPLKIRCILLKHTEEDCEKCKDMKYPQEIEHIINSKKRNEFIRDLAVRTKGNTLVLFQYVEKHGRIIHEMIEKKEKTRKVFFVFGGTEGEIRERIREITENEKNSIIVASYGTYAVGVNIRSLQNIIFASPSKSRIRVLQSIGRQLRKSEGKELAILYDIADDLTWKSRKNYTLRHMVERVKIYNEEKFDYELSRILLGEEKNGKSQ